MATDHVEARQKLPRAIPPPQRTGCTLATQHGSVNREQVSRRRGFTPGLAGHEQDTRGGVLGSIEMLIFAWRIDIRPSRALVSRIQCLVPQALSE